MNINRGSEWKKWDLHVHSFYTHLNNGYKNTTEDDYIQKIVNSELCSIGLTNYFMFSDNDYELKKKLEAKGIIVFMNLEFRLSYRNKDDDLCDFHIIFDDKLEASVIKKFLSNLDINIEDTTKKASDLSPMEIKAQGCVDFEKTIDLLNKESIGLKGKFLTGILARGKGNSRSASLYKSFVKRCDLIIHSTDSENNIMQDKSFFDSINKPLLQNSDAHDLDKIGGKFTWIKAEPTFEGLKQIIYEPETRVKIQQSKPEEKLGYNVIDSIEFFKSKFFCNQKIYFNQNLNTIIGGRSTGKSTLLELLCYKILGNFDNITDLKREYLESSAKPENIVVDWITKEADNAPEIEYFSQGKMHDLAENKDEFNKIVRNILKDDSIGNELLSFEANQQSASTEIATNIANLFALNNEIENKNASIKENGASVAIKAEIEKIKNKISALSDKEKNSKSLIEEYSELCHKMELCNTEKENSEKIKEIFESFDNVENILERSIIEKVNTIENKNIQELFHKFEEKVREDFNKLSNEIIANARTTIDIKSSELTKLKESDVYKNGEALKKQNSIFEELNTKLKEENEKLNKVLDLEKERDIKQKQQDELLNQIIQKHFSVISEGKKLCGKLNCTRIDLEIKANLKLKTENFTKFYEERFNSRSGNKNLSSSDFLDAYQKDKNDEFWKNFIKKSLKKEFVLKSGNTEQDVISELFRQFWYTIDYEISYQNDNFIEMSPGKQAFVVLKMLLDFSKKKCPILIDQPEDSLDNRAIYKDLVSYLKQKKTDRQIILVTHNANIVVGADAEQVIVANKNGNDSPNENKITFQYLTGALENTKIKTDDTKIPVLERQGIREHVCEILEGGKEAFDIREKKYGFIQN